MSNTKTAYQCDASGVFIGETMVQEDPMEPGSHLLPPYCTLRKPPAFDAATQIAVLVGGKWKVRTLPPAPVVERPALPSHATADNRPQVREHEIAIIVNGYWQIAADYRGTVYWLPDGSKHVIHGIGETLPPDALLTEPQAAQEPEKPQREALVPTLQEAKDAQINALMQAYHRASLKPVRYKSVRGVRKTYQADEASHGRVSKYLVAFQGTQSTPDGFYWIASDNTQVPFAYADLQGLLAAMGSQSFAIFHQLQTLKAAVAAAQTVEEVQAVAWE